VLGGFPLSGKGGRNIGAIGIAGRSDSGGDGEDTVRKDEAVIATSAGPGVWPLQVN